MIANIIETIKAYDYYGGGKWIELAKGKNELVTDWSSIKQKMKRTIKR